MSTQPILKFLLLSFFILISCGQHKTTLEKVLAEKGTVLIKQAQSADTLSSEKVFYRFTELLAEELTKSGDAKMGSPIVQWLSGKTNEQPFPKEQFAWIIHTFAREYYRDAIIDETSSLIQFKTFATDIPNRENEEFVKQKIYLKTLAIKLGLNFRDVDGYIQEIWIGENEESTGFMIHSDVQPVDDEAWLADPWKGEVKDGAIWGRGAIDDKGPLAAIMYGMRAILDSGFPLKNKLIILVGTDEESGSTDVSTYLKTNAAPSRTFVVDYTYPVITAEKGWCGLWLKLPRTHSSHQNEGFLLTDLQAGFSTSIVPGKATATVKQLSGSIKEATANLQAKIDAFHKIRTGAEISIEVKESDILLTAIGKTVHSSLPETGHNALMDLLVFIDRFVQPVQNEMALMAKFAATNIGFELNGKSMGISHHDDFMGDVSVAANLFKTDPDSVLFMFNFRIPKGILATQLEQAIKMKLHSFSDEYGVSFSERWHLGKAHYRDPNGEFAQKALAVYNRISAANYKATSMGAGTYARRIPNSIVFGPTLPGDEYLGHQPNEHIKLSTLMHNIEVLTHTLVEFGL